MNNEDVEITTNLLVSYAYGMLVPEVARKVRYAIETDELLRWEYEGILQLIKNNPDEDPLELLRQLALRTDANTSADRTAGDKKKQSLPFFKLLPAASVLLILLLCAYMFYQHYQSPERLAFAIIRNNQPTPFDEVTRGQNRKGVVQWQKDYGEGRYDLVINHLQKSDHSSADEQFFLAVSYLKISPPQPGKAEPLLNHLAQQPGDFTSDAWLYLGLAQTLLNENEKALQSLQHVEQTAQVKELEERLRK